MHIRTGNQVISLEHLIYARKDAPRKGGLRLKLVAGWTVDLSGTEAAAAWAALCRAVPESPGGETETTTSGHGARGRPPVGE